MDIISEIKKAIEYTKQKRFSDAEKIYKNIITLDSENALAVSCLGLLYLNVGKFKKSEKYLEKAFSINKSIATAEGLGIVKYYLNKYGEACEYFEPIINTTKNYDVYDKFIETLLEMNKFSLAYNYAEQCCRKFPFKPEAISKLIYCSINVGKLKEAFVLAEQLVKNFPTFGDGWIKMGLVYEILFHDDKAAKNCYEKAYACGDKEIAYYNLAINADKTGEPDKALGYIKKIYHQYPDRGSINFMTAAVYFHKRDFKNGYKYYIHKEEHVASNHLMAKLKRPWDGKTYKQETVLVYGDQGAGDCMMFSRYLPFLLKKFKKVKVFVNKNVYNVLKYSFRKYKDIEFIEFKKNLPRYDKSTIMSNLPYYLKIDLDNIPYSEGYFEAKTELIDLYKNKYINSDKLKIGVVWEAGGTGWRELLNRTLNVELFEPFLELEKAQVYSLQVKPTLDSYKKYDKLIDLGQTFTDFEQTAGAIKNLDVVVTVDTSVAHLAGALGVKTFMLLPYVTDWRWFDNDKKTEWYDSITIFKQKNPKTWDDVIESIKVELINM